MVAVKRRCTGAFKTAVVARMAVEHGQITNITGKVLSKSAVVCLGCQLFFVGVAEILSMRSAQDMPVRFARVCVTCLLKHLFLPEQGHLQQDILGHG